MLIKIKYHSDSSRIKPEWLKLGDWVDLATAEDVTLTRLEPELISLGVSMEIPEGFEAHLIVRSSTFKNWGIMQTNGMGIIDNSYAGDNDIWKLPVLPFKDVVIPKGTRIAQFTVQPKMKDLQFKVVEKLGNKDRGGFGSTGER